MNYDSMMGIGGGCLISLFFVFFFDFSKLGRVLGPPNDGKVNRIGVIDLWDHILFGLVFLLS